MAKGFMSVTPRGLIGQETISNIYWYSLELGLETSPSTGQQELLGADWVTNALNDYAAVLPSTVVFQDLTVRSFTVTGAPSEVLPSIIPLTGNGGLVGDYDSKGHVAKIAFDMGDLVAFSGLASNLRTSSLRLGPLLNGAVGSNGEFIAAGIGATPLSNFLNMLSVGRTVVVSGDAEPIRVSHVVDHSPIPGLTSYRPVLSAHVRPQTGFLRRRNNSR